MTLKHVTFLLQIIYNPEHCQTGYISLRSNVTITQQEVQFFHEKGFLVKSNFIESNTLLEMQKIVLQQLTNRIPPYELEHEVCYPGSPESSEAQGGDTIRRLKQAYTRHEIFKKWAKNPDILKVMQQLFHSQYLYLVQSHHNCIMTKQPRFSSETHWHKDTRYWNFNNNNLINTWLPLGNECKENGCLLVIPASHQWNTPGELLDDRLFLNKNIEENKKRINSSIEIRLNIGDLLFFHAGIFHAAGRNITNVAKNAVVFTYHSEANSPISNTNSTLLDEVPLF